MGGAGQDFWEHLRDANQFMFCGLPYRIQRRAGGDMLARPRDKKQKSTPSTKDEAQLNCVALRPQLDYEVAWRPVKGQDERPKTAPLTALHATGRSVVDVGENNMEGRHVGLDFYDLLIEVKSCVFWSVDTDYFLFAHGMSTAEITKSVAHRCRLLGQHSRCSISPCRGYRVRLRKRLRVLDSSEFCGGGNKCDRSRI